MAHSEQGPASRTCSVSGSFYLRREQVRGALALGESVDHTVCASSAYQCSQIFFWCSCIKKKVLSLHLHLCSFISSGNKEKSEYLVGEGFCTSRFMMVVQNYFEDTQTCQQVGQVFCVRLKKGSEKWKLLNFILLIFSKENVFILILFLEMIH